MHFYEIGVNHRGLKKLQTLTYSSASQLNLGDIVQVEIRRKLTTGIVVSEVSKPSYKTKDVTKVISPEAIPAHLVEFVAQLSKYYAVDMGSSIGLIMPRGVEKKRHKKAEAEPKPLAKKKDHDLSELQKNALKIILTKPDTYLLKGVTGSGKTRVYIEVAKEMFIKKLGSIILVPEIGLTSQMVEELRTHFGDNVFVIHSHQTEAERHKQWDQIRNCSTPVVVGPRSALFSPIEKLGLVVVDEEHETSYKQDQSPKYHAVRAASMLRKLTGATLILGSATPSVDDYRLASNRPENIIEMNETVNKLEDRKVEIVDMKNRDVFKKNQWISDALISQIDATIKQGKQVLIFQNRRGNSTSIICQDCGWVDECENCMIPLTHHADWAENVCHTCNYRHKVMPACPDCKKPELTYKGAGTKEIHSILTKLFPGASIERFDSDVQDKLSKLENRYEAIVGGEVDIIIGTQMIAKGLDIPNLGLVGVTNADTSLYLPDFSSAERTFQLIAQVVGRVGRHTAGTVVIQTYSPESPSVLLATTQEWDKFYQIEIEEREIAGYPPFQFLLKLTIECKTTEDASHRSKQLAAAIKKQVSNVTVLGPSPAFHGKTRTGWRWQIVVKSPARSKLVNVANNLPPDWQFELDPINLL